MSQSRKLPLGSYSKDSQGEIVILGDYVMINESNPPIVGQIVKFSPQGRCMTIESWTSGVLGTPLIVKRIYPSQILWIEKWSPLSKVKEAG